MARQLSSAAALGAAFMKRYTQRGWVEAQLKVVFGTNSINTTLTISDYATDITITRTGTGTYTGTFPPSVDAFICVGEVYSPANTVNDAIVTAKSVTAGTFGITVHKGGTAADPASGDEIRFLFNMKTEK